MTNIRKLIDLVEHGFKRPPESRPAFGKKGTEIPKINPKYKQEIENCKKFKSAEDYATNYNSIYPVRNTDPEDLKARGEAEQNRLIARWNHWNELGMLK